jgi:hypothetical protein
MVHALERAGELLRPDGTVVLIQPHRLKRPFVAVIAGRKRIPVAALINPVFQPLIDSAVRAIQSVVGDGRFDHLGTIHPRFRVRLDSAAELERYLHLGARPPRFAPGDRRRLRELWRRRSAGAQIEVTEFMTVIALGRRQKIR